MTFSTFVAAQIADRLAQARVLSVFDPAEHFAPICLAMAAPDCTVIDTRGITALEARAAVNEAWMQLRAAPAGRLLIYRPVPVPAAEAELIGDILSPFVVLGDTFPRPGVAGDSLHDLAMGAYPDQQVDVQRLFAAGTPSVAALDALGGGKRWPVLSSITAQEGMVPILTVLVRDQVAMLEAALASGPGREELQRFLLQAVEFKSGALPAAAVLHDQLWKHLLLSEFLLDLPEAPPAALATVPRAGAACREVVYQLCKRLRLECPTAYIEHATAVVSELGLDHLAAGIGTFGQIDTFAFESAAALREAVAALIAGDVGRAEALLRHAEDSLWYRDAATLQTPWQTIRTALHCLQRMEKAGHAPASGDLIDWYRRDGAAVDSSYRIFVATAATREEEEPWGVPFGELEKRLAVQYRDWVDRVQKALVARVKQSGWPLSGLNRQDRIFAEAVESAYQGGKRVLYLLVDALRYELAEALAAKLQPQHHTALDAAGALLPTKTRLGMAALTPEADGPIQVTVTENDWTPARGSRQLKTAAERDAYYQSYKGDKCLVETLDAWNKRPLNPKLPAGIDLIVVRGTEIDKAGETGTDDGFRAALESAINSLSRAVRKAFDLGVAQVVVTADHGFLYLPQRAAGDEVTPPTVSTGVKHSRFAIGLVDPADHLVAFEGAALGYQLNSGRVVVPKTLGTFGKPSFYVHGGLSIQEALIPVLTITRAAATAAPKKLTVKLSYKGAVAGTVRTYRPSVTVTVGGSSGSELGFAEEWANRSARIRLSVLAADGITPVGRLLANSNLDADTGTLVIPDGAVAPVPLAINEGTQGTIIVRAVNAETETLDHEIHLQMDVLE